MIAQKQYVPTGEYVSDKATQNDVFVKQGILVLNVQTKR